MRLLMRLDEIRVKTQNPDCALPDPKKMAVSALGVETA
jgi:hypothetical protein